MGSIRIVRKGDKVYVEDSDFYVGDQIRGLRGEISKLRDSVDELRAEISNLKKIVEAMAEMRRQ
ncbi:MAG: hypothetical protein QXE23_08690 [Nitrososphaerota archaeon]